MRKSTSRNLGLYLSLGVLVALVCCLFFPSGSQAGSCYSPSYSYSRSYSYPSYSYSSYSYPSYEYSKYREVYVPTYFVNGYLQQAPAQTFLYAYPGVAVQSPQVVGQPQVVINQAPQQTTQAAPQPQAQPMAPAPAQASNQPSGQEILAAFKTLNDNIQSIDARLQRLEGGGREPAPPPQKKKD